MTGYDVKVAKLHAASLRRFVYDIIAEQIHDASMKDGVIAAKTFDSYLELVQAVELVDGYLFLFGQQPKYKEWLDVFDAPEEDDD